MMLDFFLILRGKALLPLAPYQKGKGAAAPLVPMVPASLICSIVLILA